MVLVQVVAADLISSGSKDYVVYKIRVSDGPDEWTVSRMAWFGSLSCNPTQFLHWYCWVPNCSISYRCREGSVTLKHCTNK